MSIDMNHTRHAPGQAVKPCPRCGGALVDTGDQIWAHAIGVEPCGGGDVMNGGGSGGSADSLQGFGSGISI